MSAVLRLFTVPLMKLPREELIQRLRIGLEARSKKKIDFLDDNFPTLRPEERHATSQSLIKDKKDLIGSKKYVGNKKLGFLRPNVRRELQDKRTTTNTSIAAFIKVGGVKYKKSFSENLYDDADDLANEFLRQALKEQYGDNVKILSNKAFLKEVSNPLYKSLDANQLADELNLLNYVTPEGYKKVNRASRNLKPFFDKNKKARVVKAFQKENPAYQRSLGQTVAQETTDKNFTSLAIARKVSLLLDKYFKNEFPEEAIKVKALQDQRAVFNKYLKKNTKEKGNFFSIDHIRGVNALKYDLDLDGANLVTYLRNKHTLPPSKFPLSKDVFAGASKFYKTTKDRDAMLQEFVEQKIKQHPRGSQKIKETYKISNLQMVSSEMHGLGVSQKKGTTKSAYFDSVNNTYFDTFRLAKRDKLVKEGIREVEGVINKNKGFKDAMLKNYKKTGDKIFNLDNTGFKNVYLKRLNIIDRNRKNYREKINQVEKEAQEWLQALPDELRTSYVVDTNFDSKMRKLLNQSIERNLGVTPPNDLMQSLINLRPTDATLPLGRRLPGYASGGDVDDPEETNDEIIKRMSQSFSIGGIVGDDNIGVVGSSGIGFVDDEMSDVGTIQSLLAGIGAGIIDIPKGAFSLGASLMDLGLGTNHAAKVEKFFDDLTTLDEQAEATLAGNLSRIITNLGIPGSAGFRIGSNLAKQAMVARKANKYFKLKDKKLNARMKDALNAKGRLLTTLGGAAGIGVADAIFVGDPEEVGTIGDMFEAGPTELTPNNENDAAREVLNRMKFGLESSLLLGMVGATGSALKTGIKRANQLEDNNGAIDKILSKFRPRGAKPQKFFDLERAQIGERAADVNIASQIQRRVDKHIDAIFPQIKTAFNNTASKDRSDLMKQLNEVLLSGDLKDGTVPGTLRFGGMQKDLVTKAQQRLKELGASDENVKGIFDAFEDMRFEWGNMFSALGGRMDPKTRAEFVTAFGKKFEEYLGTTYEALRNKSLISISNFKPGQEAIDKAVVLFKDAAKQAGKKLTDEEALHYVNNVVETAGIPKGLSTSAEKTAGVMFNAPDFFINKTVLSDLEFKGIVPISKLKKESRKVIDELLGKVQDPTQTILAGTSRLSLITRRNQFLDSLVKNSDEAIAKGERGFFYDDELQAISQFGINNVRKINMDPAGRLAAGVDNPVNGKFTSKGIADALEETSTNILGDGALSNIYQNFVLYPKATSQLAKTVLSPITHMRNFISAGAFAAGNGIIPNVEAFRTAFQALQIPGGRINNELYQKLLRLGVVNSNVRLGDLQRLLQDVNFGSTASSMPGLRRLLQQGSRLKKGAEEFYTAEDDFWKITSFAMERQRYANAFKKAGITKTADELDELAADIVRNNIPNYDYVNDFIKGLRKFPVGNFVSFPAEIMRTSANILKRAFDDINFVDEATGTAPLRALGYQRLFGFGATAVAIPYGTVEAAKAIYDVSGAEMDALKRFVPEWSKNSTLVPIRGDDGELKYIDFSHANAYDTMIRPITALINNVRQGADEGTVVQGIFRGMFEATEETLSPFVSEAIWTQAATDIFLRGGRTKEGRRLYTEQTPLGQKAYTIAGHLVEAQLPGSIPQFERLGLSVTQKPDEYGREYEFGDEFAGVLGLRAVKIDPINSMKFKIADFTRGVSNARREFTSPLLKGGPVTPEEIVDQFTIANRQLFKVQREMSKDYLAARTLGASTSAIDLQFKDRVSGVQLAALKSGKFKPFLPSEGIKKSFSDNARRIGQTNPYTVAEPVINRLARQFAKLNYFENEFSFVENPFRKAQETALPDAVLPGSLPSVVGGELPSIITGTGVNNTLAKGQTVFGPLDPVFGE